MTRKIILPKKIPPKNKIKRIPKINFFLNGEFKEVSGPRLNLEFIERNKQITITDIRNNHRPTFSTASGVTELVTLKHKLVEFAKKKGVKEIKLLGISENGVKPFVKMGFQEPSKKELINFKKKLELLKISRITTIISEDHVRVKYLNGETNIIKNKELINSIPVYVYKVQ